MPFQLSNHNVDNSQRRKYTPSEFGPEDLLFRGCCLDDFVDRKAVRENLNANAIRFPNFSCNWGRFSTPESVKTRAGGRETDGCFAFTVAVARFREMATPCHDPYPAGDPENYAHVEVRQLRPNEGVYYEPEKERKKLKSAADGWSHSEKLRYREHVAENIDVLIAPTA